VESTSWHSYPKSFNIGHGAVVRLCEDAVDVEEKVDGSQFSFGIFDGEIKCRSKGAQLVLDAPEKMFIRAIEVVREIAPLLKDGWTYRGEYLAKPKHNTLCYDRIPEKHIIGFDINPGHEQYLTYEEKKAEFQRIGLETVPLLFSGRLTDYAVCRELLSSTSILGGQKIEGVVIKSHTLFGIDGKRMMGKFVSEEFKEVHRGEWKESNPGQGDILMRLIQAYRTPARWEKARQHLRDAGVLLGDPRDIGALIKEAGSDIETECAQEIKDALFAWAWPNIKRGATSGLPQWYKEQLLKESFEDNN
jgi:hypothetical protein